MKTLEGKTIRDGIKLSLIERVKKNIEEGGIVPTLAIFQVGNDDASNVFIRVKKTFGEAVGIQVFHKKFDENISESELINEIEMINRDHLVHGLIVQLPLPGRINKLSVIEAIDPNKDADGLHSKSRINKLIPATSRGIITLLNHYEIPIRSSNILVIGHSYLVGIPTALALLQHDATVTIANKETKNLRELCLQAEMIISATGQPKLVNKDMVREGQIVIDVGIKDLGDEIVGDVDFEEVSKIVKGVTPVPGGIGPLTVASLFENLLDLYEKNFKI
jgi:methylenetetrahydrofolate dehydrogenase (NADP+) / methenyltetrahydrofolate cyclohydrolase